MHQDIERGRLQAWWHLVCVMKPEIYATTTAFSEVMLTWYIASVHSNQLY